MNCSEAKYLMPLYWSNELDAKAMADYELHLQQCTACAQEAKLQKTYDDVLRHAFADQQVDAQALRDRVCQQIRPPAPRRLLLGRLPVQFAAAAALALMLLAAGIIHIATRPASRPVYTAAVNDHLNEVVRRAPKEGWRTTGAEVDVLMIEHLGDPGLTTKLTPTGYRLVRARRCRLAGERFAHLVYEKGTQEISFFVRRSDSDLPGVTTNTANGRALGAEAEGGFEVASIQSDRFMVLIVSDLPHVETLDLAREVAARDV